MFPQYKQHRHIVSVVLAADRALGVRPAAEKRKIDALVSVGVSLGRLVPPHEHDMMQGMLNSLKDKRRCFL